MTLEDEKRAARKAAFARRKNAYETAPRGRAGQLSGILAGHRGVPLAGYMPINTEIDPRPAMEEACAYGPVGIPVIVGAGLPLKFALWEPEMPLVEGAFKAKIPAEPKWIVPEIVIVPLVAFDAQGGRLGYGGGFYDRTLELLRAAQPTLALGFAFAAQEAPALPLEATDQPLDLIVTEQGIVTHSRSPEP